MSFPESAEKSFCLYELSNQLNSDFWNIYIPYRLTTALHFLQTDLGRFEMRFLSDKVAQYTYGLTSKTKSCQMFLFCSRCEYPMYGGSGARAGAK